MLDLLQRELPGAKLSAFSLRTIRPIFDSGHFFANGKLQADGSSVVLWASDAAGGLYVEATASLLEKA